MRGRVGVGADESGGVGRGVERGYTAGMGVALMIVSALLVGAVVALGFVWVQRRALALRLLEAEAAVAAAGERERAMDARLDAASVEAARLGERARGLEERREADVRAVEEKFRARWEESERARREEGEQFAQRLAESRGQFEQAIRATAAEALKKSSEQFLNLAEEKFKAHGQQAEAVLAARQKAVEGLVAPIAETLKKADEKLVAIEKERAASFGRLDEQLRAVAEASERLKKETGSLVTALRKPQVRGRYGEVQLRRVAELAGMRDYCDFTEQDSSRDEEGALRRPDMVVRLPNGRVVAVDAKTNIEAYLAAVEAATPEEADAQIERFARHVWEQAQALSKKNYAEQLDGALDFVVMFIPGDQFVDAALSRRPELLEMAAGHSVIIASPSTLIGLLRAVHVGWREKRLTDSAQELFELGRELHSRAGKALELIGDVGRKLESTTRSYNQLVGSVENRLVPSLRKFEDAGAARDKAAEVPMLVETPVRVAPEEQELTAETQSTQRRPE